MVKSVAAALWLALDPTDRWLLGFVCWRLSEKLYAPSVPASWADLVGHQLVDIVAVGKGRGVRVTTYGRRVFDVACEQRLEGTSEWTMCRVCEGVGQYPPDDQSAPACQWCAIPGRPGESSGVEPRRKEASST